MMIFLKVILIKNCKVYWCQSGSRDVYKRQITTIEPAKLKVSTTRSISNNLAGTVAGVLAVQRSGEPGYDNSSFWIRGISTFQDAGQNPLVLIDGIERDLNLSLIHIYSDKKEKDQYHRYPNIHNANDSQMLPPHL